MDKRLVCLYWNENLSLPPGDDAMKHVEKMEKRLQRRRIKKEEKKSELRIRTKFLEGITYESHMGLLVSKDIPDAVRILDNYSPTVVLFYFETGSTT